MSNRNEQEEIAEIRLLIGQIRSYKQWIDKGATRTKQEAEKQE